MYAPPPTQNVHLFPPLKWMGVWGCHECTTEWLHRYIPHFEISFLSSRALSPPLSPIFSGFFWIFLKCMEKSGFASPIHFPRPFHTKSTNTLIGSCWISKFLIGFHKHCFFALQLFAVINITTAVVKASPVLNRNKTKRPKSRKKGRAKDEGILREKSGLGSAAFSLWESEKKNFCTKQGGRGRAPLDLISFF